MTLKNMHSHASGAVPNLVPGQAAVNLKDGVLWLRAAGTKVAIDLAAWEARAVPGDGIPGAPLTKTADGVAFDASLTPSSVVEGVVAVDPPGWGVPGLQMSQRLSPLVLTSNAVVYEPFYVASDSINATAIAFSATAAPTGAVRVGLCAADGTILADVPISTPVLDSNVAAIAVTLPRGAYALVLWTGADLELAQGLGYLSEQGWLDSADGVPSFVRRQAAASADLSSAIVLPTSLSDQTNAAPGKAFSLLLHWT